ncbi:malate synthase A [Robertkochia sediminum]|uniref:malate synthase A n=1 Tax=Robertkochia sediminum TaxID=2785326 RepID=UPI0019344125|nr:malate synthase A [Robertkochia sediminum]MBL7471177.1 malate synthase A [Robertkochia sediminum]
MKRSVVNTISPMAYAKGVKQEYPEILTRECTSFLVALHREFNAQRLLLLEQRIITQEAFDSGALPVFPEETAGVRQGDWKAAPIPPDLQDRRVEITGPVDRKMMINALNSGANCFMADLEDSTSPTWSNIMEGQINLCDAVRKTIAFVHPVSGKAYRLNDEVATLIVRPRGWHLIEKNLLIDGETVSASLFDFGVFFFHNALELTRQGSGPYFYLPKLEHYLEARLWNEVFVFAQNYLSIPQRTIKATVLIETITASFQLDEIIYELKDHMAGLNCGRWDYIFSYIKKFRNHDLVTPNRAQITMQSPFMEAYSLKVIQVCHNRGVHAMGGMAAQIPVKNDPEANDIAFEKVRKDKEREVKNGHDGTWVAHPALVPVARNIFDTHMKAPNQVSRLRDDVNIAEKDLLKVPEGELTEAGVRLNIHIGLLYLVYWLNGNGAAALYHLMEDAATAEICRAQLWQWYHKKVQLPDGRLFDDVCYEELFQKELPKVKFYLTTHGLGLDKLDDAISIFHDLVLINSFEEFLTLKAYPYLE